GIEQDQPVDAHRGGLRHSKELGNRDRRVFVDFRLAGEAPSRLEFARPQLLSIGNRDLRAAREHLHLAFAARAAASAGGIDRKPDPVRGTEQRRPWRDPRCLVEWLVEDFELLLDHPAGTAFFCSVRKAEIQFMAYSS